MSFWGELKRRNVFKVGAAYLIAAWLITQVVSTAFPAFHMPEWTVTFVMFLLIIGFFVAIILAWAYEVTPEGVKLTKKVPLADSITHVTGRKLNYVLAGLIIVLVGYIVIDKVFIGRGSVETELSPTGVEIVPVATNVKEAPKTIAILPFVNLSSDPEQEYFVDGLSEELLNCLAKVDGLKVTSRTSSFAFKDTDKTLQEVAGVLGVEHILEGSVRKEGNALRITAQLIHVKDDSHLWSQTYDRELEDIFDLQEDIATAVAKELKSKLGIENIRPLGGTDNVEAYELYLIAIGKLYTTEVLEDMKQIAELLDAAVSLDPEFAIAWAAKANTHIGLSTVVPGNQYAEELDAALKAVQRAIEIEPKLGDGYYLYGFVKLWEGEWIDAESAYRKATELPTGTLPAVESYLAMYYLSVGYFTKANEILEISRQKDPLQRNNRSTYLLSLAFAGDVQGAEKEYEHGKLLFGDQWPLGDLWITITRCFAENIASRKEIVYSDQAFDLAKNQLGSPKEALKELRRLNSDYKNLTVSEINFIYSWAAYFGDPEFAMDALEKAFGFNAPGFFTVWLPVMHEVRQLPRFKEFLRKIGLVDYWNEFGWPDICRPLDNGDFVCD